MTKEFLIPSNYYGRYWGYLILIYFILFFVPFCHSDELVDQFRKSRVMDRAQGFLEEGRREVERGSWFRAVRLLSQAISRGAGPEAFELRARAYQGMGSHDQAISDLSSFIGSRPQDAQPYILRAEAYIAVNNMDMAILDYNRALGIDPFLTDAYLSRGLASVSMEKYEAAISDFELALKIDANNPDVLYNAALTCFLAGLPKAGTVYASRALDTRIDVQSGERMRRMLAEISHHSEYEHRSGGLKAILTATAVTDSEALMNGSVGSSSVVRDTPFQSLPKIDIEVKSDKPRGIKELMAMVGKENFSGTWSGRYMGMNWSASFRFSGPNTTGVLRITTPSGKVETHYCKGIFDNGKVEASDNLGFRLSGKVTSDLRFVGNITSPDNKNVSVDIPIQ